MKEQQAKHAAFKIYDSKDYFKEKSDEPIVLEEQEIAEVTVENENIEYINTTRQTICLKQHRE